MRTTLDIADDVLFAAKDFARRDGKTIGQVLSELARRALQMPHAAELNAPAQGTSAPTEPDARLALMGIRPLPSRGGAVTNDTVNQLREQEGI